MQPTSPTLFKPKVLFFFCIAAVLVALTAIVFVRREKIPPPRETPTVSLFFASDPSSPQQTQQITAPQDGNTHVAVFLNTLSLPLNGYDILLTFSDTITVTQVTPGESAIKLNTEIFNTIDPTTHTVRLARVTTDPGIALQGMLHLATLTLTKQGQSGSISVEKATIASTKAKNIAVAPSSVTVIPNK